MNFAFRLLPTPLAFDLLSERSVHGLSQITSSLYISNGVAANNELMLSTNHITTVINVSAEVANTFFKDIQYVHVPVVDAPTSHLYDFFDPVADHIHSVDMKQGRTLLHCAAGVSRSAALPRVPHEVPLHVAAGRLHVDQVMPPHHPAQHRLLGTAYPL
ncbi:hypothetical protein EI555_015005 [Monodon monoceros]|uniref:Tyrosine specific protein phosphatases domain-containing protein n=1 Tax=Monodon monoceros TaxID=40151 RepID=A0A4U1EPL0_MONMO|nr:hypothetical protein EI555_015005 [Monodon monoceros]